MSKGLRGAARCKYLEDIFRLAKTYAPSAARWSCFLVRSESWGPAHELAHAMIEPKWRFYTWNYGRCDLEYCHCSNEECIVYEAAAMLISQKLLNRADPALARAEIAATEGYHQYIARSHRERARRLLARLGLGRIPSDAAVFQDLVERRMRASDDRYARRAP